MSEDLKAGAGVVEASLEGAGKAVVQSSSGSDQGSNADAIQCERSDYKADGGKISNEETTEKDAGGNFERRGRGPDTRQRRLKGTGGLQLEKTGMWTVRCIINGKRVSKSTGTKDREEAERFLKKFLAPYVPGDPERTYANIQAAVATEKQLEEMEEDNRPQMTLEEVWDAYDKSLMRRDLTNTTLDSKRQIWFHFKDYLNSTYKEVTELRHVLRMHAEGYLKLIRNDHSALTYNGRICVLREIHRVLMDQARSKVNPWEGFKMRPDDSHTRRELTVEELSRLIDMASREGFQWRVLFAVGMYTGLRLSDCCTLSWAEVDIVRSIIQKIPEKTKKYRKGKPITVPIHKVLADLLMQTPVEERTGYVIPPLGPLLAPTLSIEERKRGMSKIQHHLGKIFHNAGIVTSVKIEGRKAKTPDATFHSLRHTFVSLSANAGVPLHIVQSIVGHESNAMTRHYFHENIAALQDAVEAIPSISETGEVRAGEVAQPDASRMFNRMQPQGQIPAPPPLTLPPPTVRVAPQAAPVMVEAPQDAPEAAVLPSEEGAGRVSTGADAPLAGRSALKNAGRREVKLAAVEAANAAAVNLGGWGLEAERNSHLPTVANRRRQDWVSQCMRKWCFRNKVALLQGSTKLIGLGGFTFLNDLWNQGVPMMPEDAVDALEVFLKAKGVRGQIKSYLK